MPKFKLCAKVTVSAYTEVEAANEAEAIKLAGQRNAEIAGFGASPEDSWVIDDADGTPDDIRIED